ncbi:flagellar biosynthesis protein FlhF [Alteromonas sp. 5E99-2]|uniref:flagellar biosynthesis protein FlhF n=1 Tax=Alteromonas sp. 5E99-2 TaxID=2817683 RepID=UPI001A99E39C|nr:flagellar biosynthesis protein FlhF [Alteromonas sp. 5E99-2]MBO1255215.1 flagellar biosynthesis protein FlhF [Alteromonas sp. 5E99-2]
MKIRRFFGKDMREALSLVKDELGQDAVIMSNRKVSDGVELVAAYDKEPEQSLKARTPVSAPSTKPVPTLSEIIGDHGPDNLKALLEQQAKSQLPREEGMSDYQPTPPQRENDFGVQASAPNKQAQSVEDDWADEPSIDNASLTHIKDELTTLRQVLQHQVADLFEAKKQRQKPIHGFICKQLVGLGLSYNLAEQLSDFVPADATERDAWRYVLQLMVNRLSLGGNGLLSQTGAVALMGPTGTGKTTTVAKLAARYAKKHGPDSVALVTIDTYRIGAFEQLQTFGKIIGCVVKRAENAQILSDTLFQLRHKKMIFIDTAGFSQRDEKLVKQLEQLSNSNMAVKRYLVLQSNTQYPALNQAIQAYDGANLDGCILTKLDECFSLGEALSVALEHQLPLSFLTDGQQVPEDIRPADAKFLVSSAAKLYKKHGMNHTNNHNQFSTTRAV